MAWWDDLGEALGQFVEEQKQNYQQLDQQLGGWLPLGYEPPQEPEPTYNAPEPEQGLGPEQWPGQHAIQRSLEGAQAPTEPWKPQLQWDAEENVVSNAASNLESVMKGHITSAIRDVPVVGETLRGVEAALNLDNERFNRMVVPFFGAGMRANPDAQLTDRYIKEMQEKEVGPWDEGYRPWEYQPFVQDTEELKREWQRDPASVAKRKLMQPLESIKAGIGAVTGTPEEQESARQYSEQLSSPFQLAQIASDPANYVNPFGLPSKLKPTNLQRLASAAKTLKPIEELSRSERLFGSVSGAAYKAAKEGSLAEVPLEQLRRRTPWMGGLTGKSKVGEDVGSMTDQVTGRIAQVMTTAASDDDKIMGAASVVQDILKPTAEAMGRMGKSGKSFETAVARKALEGYDPAKIVEKYEKGKAAWQQVADLKASGTATEAMMEEAVQAAKNLPKNADEALAMLGKELVEHASKVAKKAYGVADNDKLLDNLIGKQKAIMSTLMLATNINYPVGNAASNLTLTLLSGYNPFRAPWKSDDVMRDAGILVGGKKGAKVAFAPSRANAAMGMADVNASGILKYLPMGWAQKLEKWQGEGLWTQAFEKYLYHGLHTLLPQDVLGPVMRTQLNAVHPKMAEWLEDVIRHGDSAEEVIKRLNDMPGFKKGQALPDLLNLIPPEIKNDPDLLSLMQRAGMNDIGERLAKCKTFEEVQAVIADAKRIVAEQLAKVDDAAREAAEVAAGGEAQTGNVLQSALDFVKKDRNARDAAFAKGADIRAKGIDTAADELATEWNLQRSIRKDLLITLRARLKGVVPDEQLQRVDDAFAAWDKRTATLQAEKDALRKQYAGDENTLRLKKAALDARYTAEMKVVRKKANGELYGLIARKDAFDLSGLAPEKKAAWDEYWKRVFKPEVNEEALQKAYAKDMASLTDPAQRQARSDAYHAERQAKWAAENAWQEKAERELFGEAAEKAPTPAPKAAQTVPAGLRPTAGWKIHLTTDVPEDVSKELKSMGLKHKVGKNSGQTGKDVTIYIGGRDEAERVATDLSSRFATLLKDPLGDVLNDDVELAPRIMARFDASGDMAFHQYGYKGVPWFNTDMEQFRFGNLDRDELTRKADAALRKKYGEFYAGSKSSTAPKAAGAVAVAPTSRKMTDAELWDAINSKSNDYDLQGLFVDPETGHGVPGMTREAVFEIRRSNGTDIVREAPTQVTPAPVAQAAGENTYTVGERLKWQTFDKMLDGVQKNAGEAFNSPVTGGLPPELRKAIINAVDAQRQGYTDAKLAAMRMANVDRDFALLNYSHRYNFDHYTSMVWPFAFWQNTMMKNAAVKFMEQPGRFFAYSRYKEMLNNTEDDPGFPQRLRGMLPITLPGTPEWMGEQYVDPLGRALMFNQISYPLQAAQWANEDQSSLMGLLGSPSPLLTIPANLLGGNAKEVGTLLPLTRQLKAGSAIYKEAGLPGGENIPAGGINIEQGVRQQLAKTFPGLPEVDEYQDYRIRRMLENMVQDGEITPEQMEDALAERKGKVYERAVQKVGVESGFGQMPFVSGAINMKTYPTGEKKRIAMNADLNALAMREASKAAGREVADSTEAWKILKEKKLTGKGSVISKWYTDNPKYDVRDIVTAKEEDVPDVIQTGQTWRELNEGTVPSKWKTANLTEAEQKALQAFYDKGNKVENLTPEEKTLLKSAMDKVDKARETPEFQELTRLKGEVDALIDGEFTRLGGPAGTTNKYDWIKQANGGKTTPVIAKWYADHPDYSNYGKGASGTTSGTTGGTTGGATYSAKDPVLYAELQSLIDSEFARLGGPEGTANKYDWIKQANGGKTTSAIAKWYADHPGYSSGSSSKSTYTPRSYTPKAAPVYPEGVWPDAWKQFKKYAPELVKAASTYMQGGTISPDLVRRLYDAYKKMGITMRFDDWLRRLMKDSGLTKKAKKESKKNA